MTEPILKTVGLCKAFGGVKAVDQVNLQIRSGEMVALIGPNGAGKSTTFNLINGQLVPDQGQVLISGQAVGNLGPRWVWRQGVGRTFQMASIFHSLRVIENIYVAMHASDRQSLKPWGRVTLDQQAIAINWLEKVGLAHRAYQATNQLAYADIKRLELAIVLVHQPKLLLMDEPTAGMAFEERHALMQWVQQLVKQNNLAVLFTEHSMDVVFGYAHRVIAMSQGQVLIDADAETVKANPQVQQVYFGSEIHSDKAHRVASHAHHASNDKRVAHQTQSYALSVRQLSAGYNAAQVLHNLSLHVLEGEVVGLVGNHGAGKSTTLKTIMGLIKQNTGVIELFGKNISHVAIHHRAQAGLGFVPEDRRIFTDLTVLENLQMGIKSYRPTALRHLHMRSSLLNSTDLIVAHTRHTHVWTIEQIYDLFPNLATMPKRLGGHMSGGEQQMLAVARTLMGNPSVLLLDEPSEGVAPLIVEQMIDAVIKLKKLGLSVLLSEQNQHFAQSVSDRLYRLENGQIV